MTSRQMATRDLPLAVLPNGHVIRESDVAFAGKAGRFLALACAFGLVFVAAHVVLAFLVGGDPFALAFAAGFLVLAIGMAVKA